MCLVMQVVSSPDEAHASRILTTSHVLTSSLGLSSFVIQHHHFKTNSMLVLFEEVVAGLRDRMSLPIRTFPVPRNSLPNTRKLRMLLHRVPMFRGGSLSQIRKCGPKDIITVDMREYYPDLDFVFLTSHACVSLSSSLHVFVSDVMNLLQALTSDLPSTPSGFCHTSQSCAIIIINVSVNAAFYETSETRST